MAAQVIELAEQVRGILKRDPRYRPEAYEFVIQALHHTITKAGERRHVSARELLEGIRDYALERFGQLSLVVLDAWGVKATDDFGEIVFNLIDAKLMGKTDTDTKEDFHAVYDFHDAFGGHEPLKVEWSDEE